MANFVLVRKGKILFGVCKELEASGRGSAFLWRSIFVVTACSLWLFLFVYIGIAMFLPVVDEKTESLYAINNCAKNI